MIAFALKNGDTPVKRAFLAGKNVTTPVKRAFFCPKKWRHAGQTRIFLAGKSRQIVTLLFRCIFQHKNEDTML
jgi:hypothetical protein